MHVGVFRSCDDRKKASSDPVLYLPFFTDFEYHHLTQNVFMFSGATCPVNLLYKKISGGFHCPEDVEIVFIT